MAIATFIIVAKHSFIALPYLAPVFGIFLSGLIILSILFRIIISKGFHCLSELGCQLLHRSASNLNLIDQTTIPTEIRPFIDELNILFSHLKEEFFRNEQFSSDAAHELRTPLAALKTQTQVALLAKTCEERDIAMRNILKSVDRCTRLIHQLLTFSRLGEKAFFENKSWINLHSIAAEVVAELAPFALEKHIEIELLELETDSHNKSIFPNPSFKLFGNEMAINMLVRNLVDNAIRYTPNGGRISVELLKEEKYQSTIILRVRDTGNGIPEELRERVFERFYRIPGSESSGSGLGLPIVKKVSDAHKAKIKLGTPSDGRGLQIDIVFPK